MNRPDDMTEATADTGTMLPIELEGGEACFPTVEEARSSSILSHNSTGRYSKKNWWWLWVGLALFLVTLLVIVPAIVISQNNNSSNSSNSAVNGKTVPANAAASRPSLDSVIAYMVNHDVSKASAFHDMTSPQYQAARWLAETDGANIAIPTTDVTDVEGYRYMFRYVMALNYFALGGEGWRLPTNFLSDGDICTWQARYLLDDLSIVFEGVVCDDQQIPWGLQLDGINLKGDIPTENGNLSSLYYLSLLFNELSGSIPTELCNLDSIGYIEISHNYLTGEIPRCLGSLSDMIQLQLSNNILEGSLPPQLANLKSLEYLFVNDNMLTGDPSGVFSSLPMLQILVANNNNFTGVIDSTFLANSRNINWTDLSHNGFTSDGIPVHLFSLPQLDVLDLSHNRLAGSLPNDIPENLELDFLALYENNLSGYLPASLSNLKSLNSLDLSNNGFVGPVDIVGAMLNLTSLFLSDNPFESGPVPQSFANLTNLTELSLRNTNRNGTLPDFIGRGNFTNSLQVLDLGSNSLEGEIPATYGEQANLLYLLLNDNSGISGQIPPSFSNLTLLVGGYFDGTGLNGSMDFMCKLPNFQMINGDEGLFADCGDPSPEINCTCCVCCTSGLEGGCSRPLLSNLDVTLAILYRRRQFDFRNDTLPPQ